MPCTTSSPTTTARPRPASPKPTSSWSASSAAARRPTSLLLAQPRHQGRQRPPRPGHPRPPRLVPLPRHRPHARPHGPDRDPPPPPELIAAGTDTGRVRNEPDRLRRHRAVKAELPLGPPPLRPPRLARHRRHPAAPSRKPPPPSSSSMDAWHDRRRKAPVPRHPRPPAPRRRIPHPAVLSQSPARAAPSRRRHPLRGPPRPHNEAAVKAAAQAEKPPPTTSPSSSPPSRPSASAPPRRRHRRRPAPRLQRPWSTSPNPRSSPRCQLLLLCGNPDPSSPPPSATATATDLRATCRPHLAMRPFSEPSSTIPELDAPDLPHTVGAYRLEGPGIQLFESVTGDHTAIQGLLLPSSLLRQTHHLPASALSRGRGLGWRPTQAPSPNNKHPAPAPHPRLFSKLSPPLGRVGEGPRRDHRRRRHRLHGSLCHGCAKQPNGSGNGEKDLPRCHPGASPASSTDGMLPHAAASASAASPKPSSSPSANRRAQTSPSPATTPASTAGASASCSKPAKSAR